MNEVEFEAAMIVDGGIGAVKLGRAGAGFVKNLARGERTVAEVGTKTSRVIASTSEGTADGLLQTSSISKRQIAIHAKLSEQGAMAQFSKRSVSMKDLRAIGRVTGDEYSLYTLKGTRTVIRGYGNKVYASTQEIADGLMNGQYGRWSGHTHPPGYGIDPSVVDRSRIPVGQKASGVWGDDGFKVFGRTPTDDAIIKTNIVRKQWEKVYGKQD